VVATRLVNPRGILRRPDGSLIVAEAGVGDPQDLFTGRITRLWDQNGDGDYDDAGERRAVLERQRSVDILGRLAVNRDEVFGLADIEAAGGWELATVADPLEGSTLLRLETQSADRWTTTADNANSIAFHPQRGRWYAVQSFQNTVIELDEAGKHRQVVRIPQLERGQDPVPAAIVYEPSRQALLVALFSGQIGGDTGGSGVDFVERSGKVVRVDPQTGALENVVEGLNAPTDLALAGNDTLFVLEFCRSFADPVHTQAEATQRARHAGFERYSGRVLRVALATGEVRVLATKLDVPTHLRLLPDGKLLVTEGQGTPGRMIPGPSGAVPLEGRIVELTPPGAQPAPAATTGSTG
jgi:sugar lactone lactonase YvrE